MKNFLTFALKLGIIFLKLALLVASCLFKATFAAIKGLMVMLSLSAEVHEEKEDIRRRNRMYGRGF